MNDINIIKEKFTELLKVPSYREIDIRHEIYLGKNYITVTSMYEKPIIPDNMPLSEYFKCVEEAIGSKYIYLAEDIHQEGCETCDYGSRYGWKFLVSDTPIEEKQ